MKVELVLQNPSSYLYMERYVNKGSRNYSSFSQVLDMSPQYQSVSPQANFEICSIQIPKEKISLYLDNPHTQLQNYYIRNDHVIFCIHPEIFKDEKIDYIKELNQFPISHTICVTPTASNRTVFVHNENLPLHFIKLHYPKKISRFFRYFKHQKIKDEIEVSKDLKHIFLDKFAYLPETIGVVYGLPHNGWGFDIREFIPRPYAGEKRFLIPCFSLYAQDMQHPDDEPLLVQLIKHLGQDPESFTLNHVLLPIIKCWCTAVRERGILFGSHGQNILLEVDAKLRPTRIVHRDLDIHIDAKTRKEKGLSLNFSERCMRVGVSESRESAYSLEYDAFMGHHLFDSLANVVEHFFGVRPERLHSACKEFFHNYLPNANQYFSDKTYYYSNEVFANNSYKLIETGLKPKWR